MNGPYQQFQADSTLEVKGVNIDYGDYEFTIARAGGENERYKRVMRTLFKPHRRAIQTETISDVLVNKIMVEGFVKGCLLGWRCRVDGEVMEGKLPGPDGEFLEFSVENAVQLFTDLPDLFTDLQEQASKLANFKAMTIEDDAGN